MNFKGSFPELEEVIEVKLAPGESSEELVLFEKDYSFIMIIFEGYVKLISAGKAQRDITGVTSYFGEYPVTFKNDTSSLSFFARILKIKKLK